MKKYLLIGVATAAMFGTAANAGTGSGTLEDNDGSPEMVAYSWTTPDNDFEDAGETISAQFSFHGEVTKVCAIQGVDNDSPHGLSGDIDLGTIGISAGDDQAVNTLFTMAGPATVDIESAAAGCNYRNTLTLEKDDAAGLVNTNPGSYDSDRFQANIPYAATARFRGVTDGAGAVSGSAQSVQVGVNDTSASGTFGAWRSPLRLRVNIPRVTGKGLVGGEYTGDLTLTLAII